jgi:hypothetical protein
VHQDNVIKQSQRITQRSMLDMRNCQLEDQIRLQLLIFFRNSLVCFSQLFESIDFAIYRAIMNDENSKFEYFTILSNKQTLLKTKEMMPEE